MDAVATLTTALLAAPGQHDRLLRLHTPFGPDVLVAETFRGEERLGEGGFRFEITALSVDAHLDLDALLGKPVLLEMLCAESTVRRPFHGHVTAFEQVGSNGGLARYRLRVEPWLAFLRERVDSYVFQERTLVQIIEDVFADYAGTGALAPAWRWDLQDAAVYPVRSLTTQYQESDFAFIERLLADEGLFYWFEHEGAAGDDTLGRHVLVIADHNEACAELGTVRYHRADATERADSLQGWSPARRLHPTRLARASWDYRSLGLRPASAEADTIHSDVVIEDSDVTAPYGWCDDAHGQRLAGRQLQAMQATACTGAGDGTWRQMTPGSRFSVNQHPQVGDEAYLCVAVRHDARNNLGAEVFDALEQTLGAVALPGLPLPGLLRGGGGADAAESEPLSHSWAQRGGANGTPLEGSASPAGATAFERSDFYRNAFAMQPADLPYRMRTADGHGERMHPKPTVHGTQVAIVVSDGAPLTTDRDHRIKVQFPWQRGGGSSTRLAHPGGDDNAPANDGAWTWVRVATPWAGDNWGGVVVPRRGQEVLVAFIEGDVDRPVVVGSVYNGRGQPDAPHNQAGGGAAAATANAAAWFEGNGHPAVYTGFKSQALADSQGGTGGYQQLRFDDTPGQGRTQASTTQHATTLTLGHLKGGEDNVRETERGFGAELSTQASGAIRAGSGLLLTTEPGPQQLAARQVLAQLAGGAELTTTLVETSAGQQAGLPGEPAKLAVQQSHEVLQESLAATQQGGAAAEDEGAIGGGDGEAPGWSAPHLLAAGVDGVVTLTPADQAWVSGTQTALVAGTDFDWMSQAGHVSAVAGGIAIFTQGSVAPAGKPNRETGIALHSAQGKLSARAHRNEAKAAAKTRITIASTQADIEIAAPSKHVLLTAQGAYLKIEGGNIELGAPGVVEFKASIKELAGPKSASAQAPVLGGGDLSACEFRSRGADAAGEALVLGG